MDEDYKQAYHMMAKKEPEVKGCCCPEGCETVPILGLVELAFHQLLYVKRLIPKKYFRKVMWRGVVTYMCTLEQVKREIIGFLQFVSEIVILNPLANCSVVFSVEKEDFEEIRYAVEDYVFLVNMNEPPCFVQKELIEMVQEILMMQRPPPDAKVHRVFDYDFELKVPPPLVLPEDSNVDPGPSTSNDSGSSTSNGSGPSTSNGSGPSTSNGSGPSTSNGSKPSNAEPCLKKPRLSEERSPNNGRNPEQGMENIVSAETAARTAAMVCLPSKARRIRYEEGRLVIGRESSIEPRDGPPFKVGGANVMSARKVDFMIMKLKEGKSNESNDTKPEVAKHYEKAGCSTDSHGGSQAANSEDKKVEILFELKKINWAEMKRENDEEFLALNCDRMRKRTFWSQSVGKFVNVPDMYEHLFPDDELFSDSEQTSP